MNQLNELEILNKIKSFFSRDNIDSKTKEIADEIKEKKSITATIFNKLINKFTEFVNKLKIINDTVNNTNRNNYLKKYPNKKEINIEGISVYFENEILYNVIFGDSNKDIQLKLKYSIKKLKECFATPLDKLHIFILQDNEEGSMYTLVQNDSLNFMAMNSTNPIPNLYDNIELSARKILKIQKKDPKNPYLQLQNLYFTNDLFKIFCKFLFTYKGDLKNVTFSKSQHKVNYKMEHDVYIFMTSYVLISESVYDLVSSYLHEIGHNVFGKMSAFRFAINDMRMYLSDRIIDMLDIKNKSKLKPIEKLITIPMSIILFFLLFLYNFSFRGSEKAADKFALMCGYKNFMFKPYFKGMYDKKKSDLLESIINKIKYILVYLIPYHKISSNGSDHYENIKGELYKTPGVVTNMHDPKFYDKLPSSMVSEQFILDLFGFFLNECINNNFIKE